MKIGGIIDCIFTRPKVWVLWRHSAEPVVFDSFKLGSAVTGQCTQLTNRITFFDPKLEPMFLFERFDMRLSPDERFMTGMTSKPLFVLLGFSRSFCAR